MYLGKIVEVAEKHAIYATPQHPYTRALIAAVPAPHPSQRSRGKRENIVGDIPSALNPPSGCRFHTRCPHVMPICREAPPPLVETQPGHQVACHLMTQAQA
jgi:oligopeptide/dipeptide ABC transporter ATP-binding protein